MVAIRYITCLLCMSAGLVTLLTRSNINIAIVTMVAVGSTNDSKTEQVDLCPDLSASGSESNETAEYHGEVFDWSPGLQGTVLGCFFWTYCLCQGPSGYINGRYGGRIPVTVSLVASAIISALGPAFSHASVYLLIVSRMVMGIFQAALFPGMFVIAVGWVPPHERAMAMAMNESGAMIGNIVIFFTSGFLVEQFTWTSMFYFPAIACVFVCIVFFLFIRNKPEDHPFISEKEVAYIRGKAEDTLAPNIELREADGKGTEHDDISISSYEEDKDLILQHAVPWKKMLTNKAVLSLFFFKFARNLLFYLINSKIPFYLRHVLKEDIVSVGVIYAIFQGIYLFSTLTSAKLSEVMIERGWFSRTNCRRFFSLFSGAATAISFMLIPALRCYRTWIKVCFYSLAIFQGMAMASDIVVPPELTTNFSAILFSLSNMCHVIPGFVAPMFAGFVLGSVQDEWIAWDIIFYTIGFFLIFANIIFLIFIRAKKQDFDNVTEPPRREQRIMSIVSNISAYTPF